MTADTHVHFLSPMRVLEKARPKGQYRKPARPASAGEFMTNVGDFDGQTTWGSREAGGDGEHMVRVGGTENRQHVLGHISLLGYRGPIIAPMTTGGPDESALGDPIEILLTKSARQCKQQGGIVVLPHFPNPRAEHAASIVQRRDRCRRDDLLARSLQWHQPLFAFRLVPLSELRLPGGGGGRHGQDRPPLLP